MFGITSGQYNPQQTSGKFRENNAKGDNNIMRGGNIFFYGLIIVISVVCKKGELDWSNAPGIHLISILKVGI